MFVSWNVALPAHCICEAMWVACAWLHACAYSHSQHMQQIFSPYITQTNVYGQILGYGLFQFPHTDTWLIESLVKVPPGLLLLGTDNLAEHIGWASQRVDEQDTWYFIPLTHTYTNMSWSDPPRYPWELSCCLGATASACCLAHCYVLSGCHVVCWSRRAGCLQMARQMELCFFRLWLCSRKEKASSRPGPVCAFM